MKITKFNHSCLLVEMPAPINRTVLFDPGVMSESVLHVDELEFLDDIFITHVHPDHFSSTLLQQLVQKFPTVRITAPLEVLTALEAQGIEGASEEAPDDGVVFFNAPHENVEPLFPRPEQLGYHYLDTLTHPGDSHSFKETKAILALPVSGPWASTIKAVNLAISLKPQYVLPIHDWHWSDEAREMMYANIGAALQKEGITFLALSTGKPEVINI